MWGADSGLESLSDLAQRFGKVGVLQTAIGNRDIVPYLNRLVSQGIKLFGLSMTKPDIMAAVPWESVSSTSWISPMQYGDTIIWSHNQLKRYPKKMKDQARKKERAAFLSGGFDYDKIVADDAHELLRVSVWSWSQQVDAINRKNNRGVTAPVNYEDSDFTENELGDVGALVNTTPNRAPTATRRDPSQKQVIPFLDFEIDIEKRKNKLTGDIEDYEVPKVRIRSESMRTCDTCFLASKCPMFEPQTTCAYDIPVIVRTKEQMTALSEAMIEMQAHRVLFMKMAEDMEGGMADPILSSELDRLSKFIKAKHEMEQEGFSLTVTAKQQGQMSMVDRIFGDIGNTKPLHELEAPRRVPDALSDLGIIDSELIELPFRDEQ